MRKFLFAVVVAFVAAAGAFAAVNRQAFFVYPSFRAHAAAQMKEPSSAKFRGENLSASGWLCGEMNAKNSFGAYGGFKRFTARSESEVYIEGMGYAGKGDQQNLQLVDDLLHQSAALITVQQLIKDGAAGLSNDAEWQRLVDKLKFEARWKASCL